MTLLVLVDVERLRLHGLARLGGLGSARLGSDPAGRLARSLARRVCVSMSAPSITGRITVPGVTRDRLLGRRRLREKNSP